MRLNLIILTLTFIILILVGCSSKSAQDFNTLSEDVRYQEFEFELWDLNDSFPEFAINYINTSKIEKITKFRSSQGHDYSDDYESQRSMKHYFIPYNNNTESIEVYSPIEGTIWRIEQEWQATQLWIESKEYPSIKVVIFHVALNKNYTIGDNLSKGQLIGIHGSEITWSDIAVAVWTNDSQRNENYGYKYISFFNILENETFQRDFIKYRSISEKSDFIIPKEKRDSFGPNFYDYPPEESIVYLTNRNRSFVYNRHEDCNADYTFPCKVNELRFFDDDGCGCEAI